MKRVERSWMYNRVDGGLLRTEFVNGVQEFIEFATQHQVHKDSNQIRCPCQKCNNRRFLDVETSRDIRYNTFSRKTCRVITMKRVERSWMYNRVDGGLLRTDF